MSETTKETIQETTPSHPLVDPLTVAGGVFRQEQPTSQPQQPTDDLGGKDALPEWAQKELEKARGEAADRRVKLREAEAQLKELEPLAKKAKEAEEVQKSAEDKLREELEALKVDQQKALAAAELARKEAKLITLATKAGVSPEIAELLDIAKLDLDDEEATVATLKKLSTSRTSGGGASNPATEQNGAPSDDALRFNLFGAGRSPKNLIFGGNK